MAASQQQKVDFLLKKIGYTASKTGLAEDSSLSGTKKAPFAEAVPSPLVIANTSVWAESNQIPATPPGATGDYVRVYLSGTSGHRMTVDSTVSGNRSYIAYSTYNDNTSGILGDWIDTQFGSSYIVKVYKGDPNSGGVSLSAAGSGSSDGWFFDYSSGILNFNDTNVPSGVTDTNIYIVAYRYIGKKGVITAGAATSVSSLEVSGVSTFTGNIDANGSIDVDGQAEFDDVNISGVVTAAQFSGGSGGGTVIGEDIVTRNLTVSVGSTFTGAADFNGGADITGGLVANSAKVSDLTAGRVVVAGTDGELEDASTFTFSGGTVSATNFSGNLTGTLQTAAQTNITSVGTLGALTVSGNVNANGRIVGAATSNVIPFLYSNYSDLPSASTYHGAFAHVHATQKAYYAHGGNWIELVNKDTSGNVALSGDLDVDGHTELDNVNVSGVSTFTGAIDANGGLDVAGGEATLASAVVSDLTSGRVVTAGTSGALQDSANLTFVADKLGVTGGLQVSAGATFGDVNVDGKTDLDDLSVTGVATFSALVDGNAGANFSGAETTLSSATVSDLTDNRVVLAGTAGSLEDSSKITFDGTTLAIVGDATFTGNVSVAGTLTSEDKTELDVIGIVTARSGVRVNSGGLVVSSGVNTFTDAIDANGGLDVSGGSGLVASSAKISDLTSGRVVVAGTSGELEDASTFTFSGGTVTATAFSGTNLTGTLQTAAQANITSVGTLTALNVNGHSELDFVNVSAAATFAALVDGNAGANFSGAETVLSSATVSDLTEGRVVVAGVSGALEDASTFTFSGGTVSATNFSGNLTGTLQTAAQTNITSVGTLTALGVAGDITMSSTDTGATSNPILVLDRNSASPADNDVLGDILFKGRNDADEVVTYGSFMTKIATNTDGAEDGRLIFKTMKDGALSTVLDIKSDQMKINNVSEVFFADPVSALKFEGATGNANELTLAITDPTGDVTVTIPSCDGTILTTGNANTPTTTTSSSEVDFVLVGAGLTVKKITLSNLSSAITSVGTLGSLTVSGDITANGNIAGDNSTNITGIAGVTATTLTGTLQTAAQTNITSVGTLSNLTVSGNITANGNIVGDDATNITGIDAVIASTLAGTLQTAAQTNITSVGTLTGLNVNGHTDLDNTYISGITTFFHDVVIADTIRHDGDDNSKIRFLSGDTVSIETDNAERLRIVKGGGVGIGTTNPTAAVTSANTAVLAAGIVTAYQLYGDGSNLSGVGFEPTTGDSGTGNLYAGTEAGNASDTDTSCNIALGYRAGKALNSGDYNVFLGTNAGLNATAAGSNVLIGYLSGQNLLDTSSNVFIGNAAGKFKRGDSNIAMGNEALTGSATSANNTGACNIAFGQNAGKGITSGNNNTLIGSGAGQDITTGVGNILIGKKAGSNAAITGSRNIFMGEYAGDNTTSGSDNIGFGYLTLASATLIGGYNVAFGREAGRKYAGANGCNIYIGKQAGCGGTGTVDGVNNVMIGLAAGRQIDGGDNNIFMGCYAAKTISSGSDNIILGNQAGKNSISLCANIIMGMETGACLCNGSHNIIMGQYAMRGSSTVSDNTASSNIALGKETLKVISSGNYNVAIGKEAGLAVTGGSNIVAIGNEALSTEDTVSGAIAIGYQALKLQNGASLNTVIGYQAGAAIVTAGENTIIGAEAGKAITGTTNTIIGALAMSSASSGTANVVIGQDAGRGNTGDNNVIIGATAGDASGSGEQNTFVGRNSGSNVTDGQSNTFLGMNAGNSTTTGNGNIAIGAGVCPANGNCALAIGRDTNRWITGDSSYNVCLAGSTIKAIASGGVFCATEFVGGGAGLTGIAAGFDPDAQGNLYAGTGAGTDSDADTCYNIALGDCAGKTLNSGDDNILLGRESGFAIAGGSNNITLGCKAAASMTSGANNIALGQCSMGGADVTGDHNIVMGLTAGKALTSGANNIYMGSGAGETRTDSEINIFMGPNAGNGGTSGNNNIALGMSSGRAVTGNYNVFFGRYAGRYATSAAHNVMIGANVAKCHTTGDCNIFIGNEAGSHASSSGGTGNNNIALGCKAATALTSASANIILGQNSASALQSGGTNIIIGFNVATTTTSSCNNIIIGFEAAKKCTVASQYNTIIGMQAGCYNTSGCCNLMLGYQAGMEVTTGKENVYAGYGAGAKMETGDNNIAIGYQALAGSATAGDNTGDQNIAIGYNTGKGMTSGGGNFFVGKNAGCANTSGDGNIFLGTYAGSSSTTNDDNVLIGSYAGRCGNPYISVHVGHEAGRGVTGCTSAENVFIGCKSGQMIQTGSLNAFVGGTSGQNITTGTCNAIIGAKASMALTQGSQNTFLGSYGGNNVSTGSCNVSVGFNVALPSATANHQMAVGIATNRWITGHTDFSIGGVFKNYAETYSAIGNAGSTPTIDLEDGNVFSATLNSNATFTFTMGLNHAQTAVSFTLILTNDASAGRTISWPASVKWPNNSVPSRTTAANKTDIWSFMTPDGGTTWYGNVALYNFT